MLTQFQKRKLRRYFEFYDMDNNGFIERTDYLLFARRLARVRGWPEGSPRYEIVMGRYLAEWQVLSSFADMNADARVSLDEWYDYHDHIFTIDLKHRLGEGDIIDTIFETLDANSDGFISETEFRTFYQIHDNPPELATQMFHRLDLNSDGVLSRKEIARLYREFAHSNDPSALGNWFFGPF